jgi:SAM-dependent methyltransferase
MTPRRFLAKVLRRCAYEIDPSLFAEAAPAANPVTLPPAPVAGNFDPYQVPLRDTELSGWFNREKSELYPGITIGTQDVVADIGCGSGGHARFCAEHGAHVILADADPAQLASARALWANDDPRVEAHVTRGDPLPIADGRCTRVICNEVIEHVDDPAAFLAELARIGAPGSRYLISLPAPFGENVLKHIAHPSYFAPPNHVRIVEPEQLRRWVTDAGLVIESYSTYGAYWALWWWLFWCDPQPSLSPRHPVLDHLAHLWSALLDSQNGMLIKRALDHAIPKSQVIVARKP